MAKLGLILIDFGAGRGKRNLIQILTTFHVFFFKVKKKIQRH